MNLLRWLGSLLVSNTFCTARDHCRAYPGSPDWPSLVEWRSLNDSICGDLLKPLPPAAPCHQSEPDFSKTACEYVSAHWNDSAFHASNPVSVDINNWSNDSCLPYSSAPCSDAGYPVCIPLFSTAYADIQIRATL